MEKSDTFVEKYAIYAYHCPECFVLNLTLKYSPKQKKYIPKHILIPYLLCVCLWDNYKIAIKLMINLSWNCCIFEISEIIVKINRAWIFWMLSYVVNNVWSTFCFYQPCCPGVTLLSLAKVSSIHYYKGNGVYLGHDTYLGTVLGFHSIYTPIIYEICAILGNKDTLIL